MPMMMDMMRVAVRMLGSHIPSCAFSRELLLYATACAVSMAWML